MLIANIVKKVGKALLVNQTVASIFGGLDLWQTHLICKPRNEPLGRGVALTG